MALTDKEADEAIAREIQITRDLVRMYQPERIASLLEGSTPPMSVYARWAIVAGVLGGLWLVYLFLGWFIPALAAHPDPNELILIFLLAMIVGGMLAR